MKKILSVILCFSLVCGNVLATGTTDVSNKTTQKSNFIYKLVSGVGITGGIIGLVTALILGQKHNDTKSTCSKESECNSPKKEYNPGKTNPKEADPEEARRDFLRRNRAPSSVISREYRGEIIEAKPHIVVPKSELREFFKLFKNAPILFRGVHFPDEIKALKYRKETNELGALVSSTEDANGGNIHGSNAPDGHATYFSSYIDIATLSYAQQPYIPYPDKYNYIVLGSLIPTIPSNTVPQANDWAIFPKENERFVVCSDYIPLPRGISTLSMFYHMSDYEFKIHDSPNLSCDEESLIQIREIQVWLLRAGIVIERSRRAGHKGMFIGNFDPDKADKLLVKLGYGEELAA